MELHQSADTEIESHLDNNALPYRVEHAEPCKFFTQRRNDNIDITVDQKIGLNGFDAMRVEAAADADGRMANLTILPGLMGWPVPSS